MKNVQSVGVFAFLLLIVFLCIALPRNANTKAATADRESFWEERIRSVGGVNAYQELVAAIGHENVDPITKHEEAHYFGGALYDQVGVEGLVICDSRSDDGCYHEFLGRAIAEHGLAAAASLDAECLKKGRGEQGYCRHGIGHGLLATLGYDDVALQQALAVCADLPAVGKKNNCYAGAFMEFNMHTMLGSTAPPRAANHDLHYPCGIVLDDSKEMCVFWLAQWWNITLNRDTEDEYTVMHEVGKLCEGFKEDLQRACFEGIGNILPPEVFKGFDPALLCESASENKENRLHCKAAAAGSLRSTGSSTDIASRACRGLTGDSLEYCTSEYLRSDKPQEDSL